MKPEFGGVIVLGKPASHAAVWLYTMISWIFAACIAAQFVLAGLGIFADSAYWRGHVQFVHVFEYLPLLMAIIALTGKLSRGLRWRPFGMLILIALQYATAEMALGRMAAALHPAIAALLFLVSVNIAVKAAKAAREKRPVTARG